MKLSNFVEKKTCDEKLFVKNGEKIQQIANKKFVMKNCNKKNVTKKCEH